jgi:hypothetical protein
MHWMKLAYRLSGLSVLLAFIAMILAEWHGPMDPLSWESIFSSFGIAVPAIFAGCHAILAPEDLLERVRKHLPWYRPKPGDLRLGGCVLLLGGGVLLYTAILDVLAVLGIIQGRFS